MTSAEPTRTSKRGAAASDLRLLPTLGQLLRRHTQHRPRTLQHLHTTQSSVSNRMGVRLVLRADAHPRQ
jgi:hypothetical protein